MMPTISVLFDDAVIPAALKELDQWVCWRPVPNGERTDKIPVCAATGRNASTTDPTTWTDHGTAARYAYTHGLGLGFVFRQGSAIVGIDLDKCRDAETGALEPWAQKIVTDLNSYTEVSPSGRGLHIFPKGTLPPGRRRKGQIEVYDDGRFFTVTGHHLEGTPDTIEERSGQLSAFHRQVFGEPITPLSSRGGVSRLTDEEILSKCRSVENAGKFEELWRGIISRYPSASEADMALIGLLTRYTQDPVQVDRLFRQSGLMRDKWDERRGEHTYGEGTIQTALTHSTETYRPPNAQVSMSEVSVPDSREWPALDPLAVRGVLGDLVRAIEPHSEADPVALLIQALCAFGSVLNRGPHFRVEADSHHMNLFTALVGDTSKGRKGTSWGNIRKVFLDIDPDWVETRVLNGLSSGEGLIWAVRDEISKEEPLREKGRPTGEYETVVVDRGVRDKRLLVLESEFASTLRVMSRDGNTLNAVIRQAWDIGNLRTMTKNAPASATGAHISLVVHITKDELCRLIEANEASNGFCNRFLWVCVKRSKTLPEGGQFHEATIAPLTKRIQKAVQFGRAGGEITRNEDAAAMWRQVYPELSEGKPGLLGAVISRAEAQVMRLACLYALQDMSYVVQPEHLTAALALWEYCEASARYIFGQRLGDPIADELLTALRKHQHGMTRTEIRDWFGRNRKAHEIDRGLSLLAKRGLARQEDSQSGGRPVERWFAVSRATT